MTRTLATPIRTTRRRAVGTFLGLLLASLAAVAPAIAEEPDPIPLPETLVLLALGDVFAAAADSKASPIADSSSAEAAEAAEAAETLALVQAYLAWRLAPLVEEANALVELAAETGGVEPFISKWKMASFDGKGTDVFDEPAIDPVWPSGWKVSEMDGKSNDVLEGWELPGWKILSMDGRTIPLEPGQ